MSRWRQLVHRGLGRVKAGDAAGAADVGAGADVAAGTAEGDAEIGDAVLNAGRLAAVFVVHVEDRTRVNVILQERDELAVGRGPEADALLRTRAMADGFEHHLAADDELHGLPRLRAAAAASAHWGQGQSLPPKPEPRNLEMTRTFSVGRPNIWASTARRLTTPCEVS